MRVLKYDYGNGETSTISCFAIAKMLADFNKKRKCTIRVAKTKALISFAVTAKLICAFVFA